jgi:hypothetical protein
LIALRLIETADPVATVEVSADLSPEDVKQMSYSELIATAQAAGIEIPEELPIPPMGANEGAKGLPGPSQTA